MPEQNQTAGTKNKLGFLARRLIGLIGTYQKVAPTAVRQRCRFDPSCSDYARLALEQHRVGRALKMIAGRLRRCRYPNGGIDYP